MRTQSLDLLKLCMAFFIVFLHFHFLKDFSVNISLIFNEGIFRVAVPVFLLISGYFYSELKNKKAYLKNLLIIYIIWSCIYIPYWINDSRTFKIIEYIFYGYFQLWYLTTLIFTILLFNIIQRSAFICIAVCIMFFFLNITIEYGINYDILDFGMYENIARRNIFLTFPYFYTGHLIYKYKMVNYFNSKQIFFFLSFSCFFVILESLCHLSYSKIYTYDNFITLPFFAFFLFLMCLKLTKKWNNRNVSFLSEKIYLTHGLLLPLQFKYPDNNTAISLFVLFISIVGSYLLYKYFKDKKFAFLK